MQTCIESNKNNDKYDYITKHLIRYILQNVSQHKLIMLHLYKQASLIKAYTSFFHITNLLLKYMMYIHRKILNFFGSY